MATAAEGVETEKTPAERLFEAARDGDVAALDALLPDATAEQLHEEHQDENEFGIHAMVTPLFQLPGGTRSHSTAADFGGR